MDPTAIGWIGLYVWLALAALFCLARQRRGELVRTDGRAGDPWCASEGDGSPGGSRRRRAADDIDIAAIWAFRPEIIRWVFKRGVPDREAEDLAQTIIESAWRSRRRWNPESCSLHCWLYVIMRNHVHTYRHSGRVRYETSVADPLGRALAREDPAAVAEAKQSYKRAVAIRDRIPPRLVDLFTRYEIDGEPMGDVAAALGLPLSTARGQLQQARAMIAREVAREDALEARLRPGRRS